MDSNYANAYIKTVTDSLQEHVLLLIHAKARQAVSENIIQSLQTQIQSLNSTIEELTKKAENDENILREKNAILAENQTLKNKASTLDSALNQISTMKKTINEKDEEIKRLNGELLIVASLKTDRKQKRKSSDLVSVSIPIDESQDF